MGQAAGAASTDGRKAARLETERKSVKQNRNEHLGLDGQSAVTERRGRQERPAAQPRAGATVVTGCGEVEGSTCFLNALWARPGLVSCGKRNRGAEVPPSSAGERGRGSKPGTEDIPHRVKPPWIMRKWGIIYSSQPCSGHLL